MINHFITLLKIAIETEKKAVGKTLVSVLSFRKNEILFSFSNQQRFCVFLYPAKPIVFLEPESPVPTKNIASLFPEIHNRKLLSVSLHESDRILLLTLEGDFKIFVSLFSASSGITIIHEKTTIGAIKYEFNPLENTGEFHSPAEFCENPKMLFPFIRFNPLLKAVFEGEEERLLAVIPDLQKTETYYKYSFRGKSVLSALPLPGVPVVATLNDSSRSIKYFVFDDLKSAQFVQEKKNSLNLIEGKIKRTESTLFQLQGYLEKNKDTGQLQQMADLLMAQPLPSLRGISFIDLPNIFLPESTLLHIPLNPELTLAQNASDYYRKTRNFKAIHDEKAFLLQNKKKENAQLNDLLLEIEGCTSLQELNTVRKRNTGLFSEIRTGGQVQSEPFHRIQSKFGYELFIGKHAKGNDFLLNSVAKKNDIWFHVRGDSGSHVILPFSKKEFPGKDMLAEAASFAAYFSGQRKSEWVPVSYTQAKYVRKVKGGAPGSVIIDREELIFVKPASPPKSPVVTG